MVAAVEALKPPRHTTIGRGVKLFESSAKIALGTVALLMGASLLATGPHFGGTDPEKPSQAHMRLAALSTQSRRDVDYALLDARLKQLMTKPTMVGMAV